MFTSSTALLIYLAVSTERSFGQAQSSTETDGADRLPNLEILFIATVFIYLLFYVQSLLNISVVWMEIARKSSHMQNSVSRNLDHYAKYVYGFDLCLTIVGIILISVKLFYTMILLLGIVILLVIIPSYIYGGYKILKVLQFLTKTTKELQGSFNKDLIDDQTRKFQLQMNDIVKTSLLLVLVALINIAFLFFVFIIDGTNCKKRKERKERKD